MVRLLHLFQGQIDGVVKRRRSLGSLVNQAVLNLADVGGEILLHRRPVGEGDQQVLIGRIAGFEEGHGRISGTGDLVSHAAADIEQQPDGGRNILIAEVPDLLLDLVFEDAKVLLFQSGNEAAAVVGDGGADQNQIHVDLQRGESVLRRRVSRQCALRQAQ